MNKPLTTKQYRAVHEKRFVKRCRRVPECGLCFCEGLPDRTVVFLTVGPHEKVYALREEAKSYQVGSA